MACLWGFAIGNVAVSLDGILCLVILRHIMLCYGRSCCVSLRRISSLYFMLLLAILLFIYIPTKNNSVD